MTLHGELVVVRGKDAEAATLNFNGVVFADGFRKGEERAALDRGSTLVLVLTGHDECTGTILDQRTLVTCKVIRLLLFDFSLSQFEVFLTPLLCVAFRNDVILLVISAVQNNELVTKNQFRLQILIIVGQPCLFFFHALVESDIGDIVGPNVKTGVGHVVIELAKELARP